MSWEHFILFAIAALICWGLGAFTAWKGKKPAWTYGFTLLGLAIFFSFILGMWISLERPPMRTMGETRLWYSFFLPLAGLITYVRWKYKWILSFSCILSLVFICINLFKFFYLELCYVYTAFLFSKSNFNSFRVQYTLINAFSQYVALVVCMYICRRPILIRHRRRIFVF